MLAPRTRDSGKDHRYHPLGLLESLIFMATEATLLDMSSCISEVAEVHLSVLFDLLVMLAMVFGTVAPGSPLERQ